jgi:hypothetical protein
VLLHTEVVRVHHNTSHITHVTLKNRHTGAEKTVGCSGVISSIPITLLVQQMSPAAPPEAITAAKSLRFRNTILVYLIVDCKGLFPDNWLYINEPSVQLGRVTNFANWSLDMLPNQQQTPLCCEYWCNFEEPMWTKSDDELRIQAAQELRKIGLLHGEQVSGGFVVRLPRTYPIYAGNYHAALSELQTYFKQFNNLQLIGRYGSFKYNNQDHSLLMGILAAENVLAPKTHDLWSLNSDSEYQEEASTNTVTTLAGETKTSKRWQVIQSLRQCRGSILTGGTAMAVDVSVFSMLTQSGWWYVCAFCISYFLGLMTNFGLRRRFVSGMYWGNTTLQVAVVLNCLLANLGLLKLLLDDADWEAIPARLASAACVAMLSFTGRR